MIDKDETDVDVSLGREMRRKVPRRVVRKLPDPGRQVDREEFGVMSCSDAWEEGYDVVEDVSCRMLCSDVRKLVKLVLVMKNTEVKLMLTNAHKVGFLSLVKGVVFPESEGVRTSQTSIEIISRVPRER